MASLDGEPRIVLQPVKAENLELFGDRTPVVFVPSRPIADFDGPTTAGSAGPTIALRLDGKFDGSLAVLVNYPTGATGKGKGAGGANQVWANQSAAINGPIALDQFGGSYATYAGASGSSSNGCGGLLVLAVIVLLMMLAAGGSLASFSSRPSTSYSAFAAPPANTQLLYAPANSFGQRLAAPVVQPAAYTQGTYCSTCTSQAAVGIGSAPAAAAAPAPAPAPAYATSPAWVASVQVDACMRNPSCPGACPVAPFCANQLAVKGACNPATGAHVYYFPGQAGYVETQIGLYVGDAYFCNFSEAVAAGFMLAP